MGSALLRAITHPLRLRLLSFIHGNREVNVNAIYNTLKLEQSITSQHLKVLRDVDIVRARRDGKFIFYAINYPQLRKIVSSVNSFFGAK